MFAAGKNRWEEATVDEQDSGQRVEEHIILILIIVTRFDRKRSEEQSKIARRQDAAGDETRYKWRRIIDLIDKRSCSVRTNQTERILLFNGVRHDWHWPIR